MTRLRAVVTPPDSALTRSATTATDLPRLVLNPTRDIPAVLLAPLPQLGECAGRLFGVWVAGVVLVKLALQRWPHIGRRCSVIAARAWPHRPGAG